MSEYGSTHNNEENVKELYVMISENPDLPLYYWVDPDICMDSERYCLGETSYCRVGEILISDEFERVFDEREYFMEVYYDYHEDEFDDIPDYMVTEKLKEICNDQPWQRCIIVTVTPA